MECKSKEAGSLDQAVTEWSSDGDGVPSHHDAIQSYLAELEKQCIAKPGTVLNARCVVIPKLLE